MPEITIRQVESQEMLDIMYLLDNYAFRPTPPFPEREEWERRMNMRAGPRYYALFEDGEAVSILACPALAQNVRGKLFKMGGIADVSTHPQARRKGYSRRLLVHAFQALRENGRVMSCLYPFRESFYERLGFVTFPQTRKAIFETARLSALLERDLGGEVALSLIGAGYDDYLDFVRQMQPGVHGMAVFEDSQKESARQNRSWLVQARVNRELVGIMVYSLKGEVMMHYNLQASRFYYRTSLAKYLLLAWLARHIDQADTIELWLPAFEQPNTWFADLDLKLEPVFVAPMGRVLDIAGLGGMQVGPGSFSARISDPFCSWNEGCWRFSEAAGMLQVALSSEADCELTIQGLSALVYGVADPADFAIRGWGSPSSPIQALLRCMFPPRLPYLHEYY